MLADNPSKRDVERVWLWFTPVWASLAGTVMITGLAEGWGDVELMALGVGLAVATIVLPYFRAQPEERARPIVERTATKMAAAVTLSYGTALAAAMPVWVSIDERSAPPWAGWSWACSGAWS